MGREKKTTLAAATAGKTAKERHQRTGRDNSAWTAPVRTDLIALPEKNITSKHKSYFQVFENHDKKEKKLEFEVSTDKIPPPGFEFVPIGNPELTKACKDLSRERDAMIFIVSVRQAQHLYLPFAGHVFNDRTNSQTAKDANANKLALQMSRSGHHIRRTIVEEARALIGEEDASSTSNSGEPEPIPDSQEEYNAQADAALRDLFPRIPNTDRQMIIEHAFKKGGTFQGQPVVGMVGTLPLSRRVQLAVLAHIRHNHTRYDQLLREAGYPTARKVVEQHCLDFLVKWRGDEETGRDQFDEILREVIVLSDDSDEDSEDDESSDEDFVRITTAPDSQLNRADYSRAGNSPHGLRYATLSGPSKAFSHRHPVSSAAEGRSSQRTKPHRSKKTNRGFKRYEAVAKRWEEAVNRNRYAQDTGTAGRAPPMDRIPSQGSRRLPSLEIISPVPRADSPRNSYMTLTPSHFYRGGHNQGQSPRPNDRLPVANLEPQRHVPMANYAGRPSVPLSGSQSVPPEAMIVGRRITRVPVGSDLQSGPAPQRSYHEELKDYLVPSIEPASPHSGPDVPQFVRQVIRGEPRGPEQVPAGRTVPFSRPPPLQNHTGDFKYDQSDPGSNGRLRPAMPSRTREQVVTQRDYFHGSQPNLAVPENARRVYRVREPLEDNRRSREVPVITSKRVIRVHREASPPRSWETDSSRVRDLSPPRMDQYTGRTLPLVTYGNTEPRRIAYGEASASRFRGYDQNLAPSSAQLHHREAHRAPSPGFQQGSTFIRPGAFVPVHPTATAVQQDPAPRPFSHEMNPTHQHVAGYHHRGRVNISD
ncbi:hypothetical protein FJTKL_11157 [Diaporthe vaccinii]|uniref:DUF2293 domain-containing protein n=1 Tax=Diaporthe vaccinii TaxID=105482 RepID=A0ABR4EI42_9PEZI